jgi:hypothetical protein
MDANETSNVRAEEAGAARVFRIVVGVMTVLVLSPVVGMILVFAVLPALPIALAVGAVIGPMDWFKEKEEEAEARFGHRHWLEVPA